MSVLIKNMKMPKSCDDCEFIQRGIPSDWCYFTEEDIPCDCPLIEIPTPHGRLIDADAKVQTQLYDDEHEEWTDIEMTVDEYLGYCFNEVPTIIPASEEGE